MTALLGLRLNKGDAQCDKYAIYMDRERIAERPADLPDAEWSTLCRYVCNAPPVVERLEFRDPAPDDPSMWLRAEAYFLREERSTRKGKK